MPKSTNNQGSGVNRPDTNTNPKITSGPMGYRQPKTESAIVNSPFEYSLYCRKRNRAPNKTQCEETKQGAL
jgi:hypothetical protein